MTTNKPDACKEVYNPKARHNRNIKDDAKKCFKCCDTINSNSGSLTVGGQNTWHVGQISELDGFTSYNVKFTKMNIQGETYKYVCEKTDRTGKKTIRTPIMGEPVDNPTQNPTQQSPFLGLTSLSGIINFCSDNIVIGGSKGSKGRRSETSDCLEIVEGGRSLSDDAISFANAQYPVDLAPHYGKINGDTLVLRNSLMTPLELPYDVVVYVDKSAVTIDESGQKVAHEFNGNVFQFASTVQSQRGSMNVSLKVSLSAWIFDEVDEVTYTADVSIPDEKPHDASAVEQLPRTALKTTCTGTSSYRRVNSPEECMKAAALELSMITSFKYKRWVNHVFDILVVNNTDVSPGCTIFYNADRQNVRFNKNSNGPDLELDFGPIPFPRSSSELVSEVCIRENDPCDNATWTTGAGGGNCIGIQTRDGECDYKSVINFTRCDSVNMKMTNVLLIDDGLPIWDDRQVTVTQIPPIYNYYNYGMLNDNHEVSLYFNNSYTVSQHTFNPGARCVDYKCMDLTHTECNDWIGKVNLNDGSNYMTTGSKFE